MGFVNQIGTIWGSIPQTSGQIYWVAPSESYAVGGNSFRGSDGHDGLSPERACRTINYVVDNLVTAGNGDVIVLLPGSHTATANIALNKAGVTITGLPGGAGNLAKQRATLTVAAGGAGITITAADIEIAYVNIVPITAQSAIALGAGAAGFHIHHCYFDMATPAASTSTAGITAVGAAPRIRIADCVFDSDGAQGPAITLSGTIAALVEDNVLTCSAGSWAVGILCGAATDQALIRRNAFVCSGTAITAGISGTGATLATGVTAHDNRFSSLVTVPVDNFDASECELSNNYDCGVGGGDGGALITAIT